MLPRTLEPEVMDDPADALLYDRMDHREVNRAFVADLLAAWTAESSPGHEQHVVGASRPDRPGEGLGEVLDVGTGTALIPIALCRAAPHVRVRGVDASLAMLELGWANIVGANLVERVRLEPADASRLPYDDGQFAAVISNSIVHHLSDPRPALSESLRVLAPGGLVFFRDLLRPSDESTLRRLVDTYAAGAEPRQRALFADSLRAALTVEEVGQLVASLGYDAAHVLPTSDRHWTWVDRKR